MSDVFDKNKRSEVMALIKSKNSKAELIVFKYLRQNNVYFQKHYKGVVGTPDIALPRKKRAVFIDGDFWHGRSIESLVEKRGEDDYWTKKIRANIARDLKNKDELKMMGWGVMNVWESDLKRKSTRESMLKSIKNFLTS
jgi:DNA mismatch endonuclease (patch repair protein)